MNSGFSKVRPLHGGLDALIAAGYPVDELPAPDKAGTLGDQGKGG